MARTSKRFAVGHYMKAKRDMALQLAKEKASLTTAGQNKKQQVRRLTIKVNFIYSAVQSGSFATLAGRKCLFSTLKLQLYYTLSNKDD